MVVELKDAKNAETVSLIYGVAALGFFVTAFAYLEVAAIGGQLSELS